MTWTYTAATLATSNKDQVRFLIGDVDSTAPLVQDEEITFALTQENNNYGAAARCCESIANNFLRKADVRIGRGGTTLTYSVAAKQYADMAAAFRKRANGMNAPWAGGRSADDKLTLARDSSLVQPIFSKEMFDDPLAGGASPSIIEDQD